MSFEFMRRTDPVAGKEARDPALCRTGHADGPLVPCLMSDAEKCRFAGFINNDAYCLHPRLAEILGKKR